MAYFYNGLLCGNENEQLHITTWIDFTKHNTEQDNPDIKDYVLYGFIYIKLSKKKKSIILKVRRVVTFDS